MNTIQFKTDTGRSITIKTDPYNPENMTLTVFDHGNMVEIVNVNTLRKDYQQALIRYNMLVDEFLKNKFDTIE